MNQTIFSIFLIISVVPQSFFLLIIIIFNLKLKQIWEKIKVYTMKIIITIAIINLDDNSHFIIFFDYH